MSATFAPASSCNIGNEGRSGPLTRARQRRTLAIYLAMAVAGLLPWLAGGSPALRAGGLGLMLPGGGFLAVGGWWILLLPLTLVLFGVSLIAWFGAGMSTAPVAVWLGTALVAAALGRQGVWAPSPWVALAITGLIALRIQRKAAASHVADLKLRDERRAYLPAMLDKIERLAAPRPDPLTREFDTEQLAALRYCLDRALQPVGTLDGFTRIDQFQTAALRYQLNQLGFILSTVQCRVTPNFHGYLSEAQRRVIEQYLQRPVWSYWFYENLWGNLTWNADPAVKDNIMLTGFLGINVALYMSNTGDRRYLEKGSLPFRWNAKTVFLHDAGTIIGSVLDNMRRNPFVLYPCEPNWIYTPCNFRGITAIRGFDRVCGTNHFDEIKAPFFRQLDAEFTRASGSLVALRSSATGLPVPFPYSEENRTTFDNGVDPAIARQDWAITRHNFFEEVDGTLTLRLPAKMVDFGNYKTGPVALLGGLLNGAREIGDREAAAVVKARLDEIGGRRLEDGVLSFHGSNAANLLAMGALLADRDDWHDTVRVGPPETAFTGPLLSEAAYPQVLVARATSPTGRDLDLVLYDGAAPGLQRIGITRLVPNAAYQVSGDVVSTITADVHGQASLDVVLSGRTAIRIAPALH